VLKVVGMKDGALLSNNLIPHCQLQLKLLDGEVLPLHHTVVNDPAMSEENREKGWDEGEDL